MFSYIRSRRSALMCLAGLACLVLLLLLAVVGLFLAAFPAAAQNPTPAGPNSDPRIRVCATSHSAANRSASAISISSATPQPSTCVPALSVSSLQCKAGLQARFSWGKAVLCLTHHRKGNAEV